MTKGHSVAMGVKMQAYKWLERPKPRRLLWTCALLPVAVAAACGTDVPPQTTAQSSPDRSDGSADQASLRAAYITAVQAGAPEAYHVMQAEGSLQARNPSQRFASDFTSSGVRIRSQRGDEAWSVSLAASRYGCAGDLRPFPGTEPEGATNRVEYRHAHGTGAPVTEWYVNGPLGLEQGFTLSAAPSCQSGRDGELRIELSVGGDLGAAMTDDGEAVALRDGSGAMVLRYGDLFVRDAGGRALPAHLGFAEQKLTIDIDATGAAYPIVVDPLVGEPLPNLLAADGQASDVFGFAVSISGDSAVVGAPSNFAEASAYVFVRTGGTWVQQQKLTANLAAVGDRFGFSVGISGDTAVIGAPGRDSLGSDSGAAYVFVRNGSSWVQQTMLIASDGGAMQAFGTSVGISEDTVVVGAPGDDDLGPQSGSAYVFNRSGSTWVELSKLTASDGNANDQFGLPVAISGGTAIVGARGANIGPFGEAGAAYVFVLDSGTWFQQKKLTASDPGDDVFGSSVAISEDGDTVVVGAPSDDDGSILNSGSAYVFVSDGGSWPLQQKLIASDEAANDTFGSSVAISGNTALVGVPFDDHGAISNSGSAYVFVRNGSAWTEQPQKLTSDDEAALDSFGTAVAISGSMVLVGAPGDDDKGVNAGVVYAFDLKKTNGDSCVINADCSSGHCVGGVCCNAACDGGCGTCSTGTCTPLAASTSCRASAGGCDVAEVCDGSSTACPANAVAAFGAVCRASVDAACDVAETCDGVSAQCPADVVAPNDTSCDDGNACTKHDSCSAGVCTGKLKLHCP